jgi:predicted NBD/HSP70 family sugar kinase
MSLPLRSFVRAYNRYNILNTIRTSGRISRIDISKTTGLSQATVTGITSALIKKGLVVEKEAGAYGGGRPPVLLAINPDGTHVLGVNVESGKISVVIINFQAEVKASYILPFENNLNAPEELAEKITQAIQSCIWESNFSKDRISGVGVGFPAIVDFKTGIVRYMANYGWTDIYFRDILQKRINHRIFIDNQTNNMTLAEHWYGEGYGSDNFTVIAIASGVRAGFVVNGQLLRGNLGLAGEFGHISINPDGPLCKCGKKGCISAYAGIDSILSEAEKIAAGGRWNTPVRGKITFNDVLSELRTGNPELLKIYHQAGWALGLGISHLIALLNPERTILIGDGIRANSFLFNSMFETIKINQLEKHVRNETDIIIKARTDEDWAKGAGTLVLQEIYKSPAIK